MLIHIHGRDTLDIRYIVFDFNGTIATGGYISETTRQKLIELSKYFALYICTSDTNCTAEKECLGLPIILKIFEGEASFKKANIVESIGANYCACFGNGFNDIGMFEHAALSIGILGSEGICTKLLMVADLIVTDICDGIDLFLNPSRIIADLRV